MAQTMRSYVVFFLLLSVFVVTLNSTNAEVPAVFILGDSTVDVGTNNHFGNNTMPPAKADFPHNGIDFPFSRPTGRFSNGLNTADHLSQLMGLQRSPSPFLDLLDKKSLCLSKRIMKGVNFASGASGLLNDTGRWLGKIISVDEQIQQFIAVRQELEILLGSDKINSTLSKSIFIISAGSNDIFDNFRFNVTPNKTQFIATLKCAYENHIKTLYSLGARKFEIISIPPVGCCPYYRVQNKTTGGCLEELNEYSQMFHSTIEVMLQKLSFELPEMKYSLGNTYKMVTTMMKTPSTFNLTELRNACCGTGTFNGEGQCLPAAGYCLNRDQHLFWDWFHPTQAAARLAALALYGTMPPTFVTPINLNQLLME